MMPRRKGKKIVYVPKMKKEPYSYNLALKWIKQNIQERAENSIKNKQLMEFIDLCFFPKNALLLKRIKLNNMIADSVPYLYFLKKKSY
jgi:hypothetical protein